jgi:4-alpha-glucanotransferase
MCDEQRRVASVNSARRNAGARAQRRATVPALHDRASGVLLHLTSLPGPHGNGDLGAEAVAFADMLARTGQRWWQMLPVGPAGYGDSPYSAMSAFAGNPLLVDLDALGVPIDRAKFRDGAVDYEAASTFREKHLRRAFQAEASRPARERSGYRAYVEREASWLDDYALFAALKRAHGNVEWTKWEAGVRKRVPAALERARKEHASEIELAKFVQWKFDEQWSAFRAACTERGIGLIGDLPIFVAHDSADVWQHPEVWKLDDEGVPTSVAGVPPDYFSETGQRWGNPLYRWAHLAKDGYSWWVDRVRASLSRFDAVRLDHFIGFVRYWQVPGDEETAMNGRWMKGPGRPLFDTIHRALGDGDAPLPFIAEDLGAVTPNVTRLRRDLHLPGMRIVQFAFGDDPQVGVFKPHNHVKSSVVYTGTHDNDTIAGWFHDPGDGKASTRSPEQTEAERQSALAYLGRSSAELARGLEIHWEMIRLAMSSVASTAIMPVQDLLGLGSEARMNSPGKAGGNWRWRLEPGAITPALEKRLLECTRTYGRDLQPTQQKQEKKTS